MGVCSLDDVLFPDIDVCLESVEFTRAAWGDQQGPLPITEGTVIRLSVEKLPSGVVNKHVWLWWSGTGADPQEVDRCWQAFLRRFDVEHTFRLRKQTLGWTRPKLRDSQAADRWTWLLMAAHAQLRLARSLGTCVGHESGRRNRTDSPQPGSVAGSGTCGRRPAPQPVHRNRPALVPVGRPGRRTAVQHPATTSAEC